MAQPIKPAGTAAVPLQALRAALKLLMPSEPAKKHQPLNGLHLINEMISNYFKSPWRAGSVFR